MKSLRAQLTLRLLCAGALLFGAAGAALDWHMRRALTAEFDAALRTTAHTLTLFTEHKAAGVKLENDGAKQPAFMGTSGNMCRTPMYDAEQVVANGHKSVPKQSRKPKPK